MSLRRGRVARTEWHGWQYCVQPIFDPRINNDNFLQKVRVFLRLDRKYLIPNLPGETCVCSDACQEYVERSVWVRSWNRSIGIQRLLKLARERVTEDEKGQGDYEVPYRLSIREDQPRHLSPVFRRAVHSLARYACQQNTQSKIDAGAYVWRMECTLIPRAAVGEGRIGSTVCKLSPTRCRQH